MSTPRVLRATCDDAARRDVVERIARFNAGREPERLALKYEAMGRSAFAFLRGTAHLFWEDWRATHPAMDDAPYVWTTGDLHLENVGSFRGDNRLVYFDLNDFDESALAPATWEIARFVTSVHVGAASLELATRDAASLAKTFLDAYVEALADGKARWVERATATGMVKELLASVKRRTREALLDSRTVFRGKRRRLRVDGRRTLAIPKHDIAHVVQCIQDFARSTRDAQFYDVLDVARRVAGTASLGLERYVALVRGSGSPDGNWLLDLKEARPSALAAHLEHPQPLWPNEAERVVRVQHRMQAISPALLQSVSIRGRPFVLRELQPTEDRLALEHWHGRLGRLHKVMITVGHLVAWAQLRSSSRDGSARIDDLIELAHRPMWRRELLRTARAYATTVERDWRRFRSGAAQLVLSST
jgi:uncharacterized protein (DUF2252 family)